MVDDPTPVVGLGGRKCLLQFSQASDLSLEPSFPLDSRSPESKAVAESREFCPRLSVAALPVAEPPCQPPGRRPRRFLILPTLPSRPVDVCSTALQAGPGRVGAGEPAAPSDRWRGVPALHA